MDLALRGHAQNHVLHQLTALLAKHSNRNVSVITKIPVPIMDLKEDVVIVLQNQQLVRSAQPWMKALKLLSKRPTNVDIKKSAKV